MDDIAIKVDNVSKLFKLPHEKTTSLKSAFIHFYRRGKTYEMQQALKDVSFEVKKGEFFGIIGRNGSGKSTMLKLLAGIYVPTEGNVQVNGKLTPFIELGVGFNPELTGRDNVFLNGALLGFNRREMLEMYNDIVEFAEIEKFMDQKLKNYSSGMQVRLAFSIAIRAKSDILLIDEVLAVGDSNFQKKCIGVFEELKRAGRTIIFVSHSMGDVREFCDRVTVIDDGKSVFTGNTEKGVDVYNKLNFERESIKTEEENKKIRVDERLGNGKVRISEYRLLNSKSKKTSSIMAGEEFTVRLKVTAHEKVKNCAVGVMFRKNPQENLYGLNSYYLGNPIKELNQGEAVEMTFKDRLPLNPGKYYLSFAAAGMKGASYEDFDNLNNILTINVSGSSDYWGIVHSEPTIKVSRVKG